jgi:hypothetical protein
MSVRRINLRAWPGRPVPTARRAPNRRGAERLVHRGAMVLVVVAERGAVPERLGLGVALATLGPTIAQAFVVVADDLCDHDPGALAEIRSWAKATTAAPTWAHRHPDVVTHSQLCDPDHGPILRAYTGGAYLLTADEGRTLGLLAVHAAAARGTFDGGFSLGLPGWGEVTTWTDGAGRQRQGWRALAHRPVLRAKALGGHGLRAEWGRASRGGKLPSGGQAGHWERGRPFLGRIVDLIGPAFALDGIDSSDLAEHLAAFGLTGDGIPAALPITAASAVALHGTARAIHALALALDEEADRWW